MTRKALIELAQRRLKFTDSKLQFSYPYVEGVMDIVWQQLCSQVYDENVQDINFYSKLYPEQPIVTDIDDQLYHVDIPEEMIRLPRIGEGVISVNQLDSRSADFKPIKYSDARLMTSQEVFRVGGDIYWWVRYPRIYFGESLTQNIIDQGVDVNLCIPFSKYSLTEELPLPAGQSQTFIQSVIEYLIGTPPVTTDNKNEM